MSGGNAQKVIPTKPNFIQEQVVTDVRIVMKKGKL